MKSNKFFKKPASDGQSFKTGASLKKTSGAKGIAAVSGGKGLSTCTPSRPKLKGFGTAKQQ